jgi:outer membrane receptor protein involved in Fe transport
MNISIRAAALCLGSGAIAAIPAAPAWAQNEPKTVFDIAAQPLGTAVQAIAVAAGESVIVPSELVEGLTAPAVRGRYSVREALNAALAGSGLRARRIGAAFVIERDPSAVRQAGGSPPTLSEAEIVVTGTRLRGTPVASTVVTVARDDIVRAGQSDLGEVARALPQSYGGGQNPGVGFNVPNARGVNVGSGSSFNLRGLGSDATLTLLNGTRLPYSSSSQSIDVSAIPVIAVDRIEIVPDGSSALYGSDAVAGVVNILLRDRVEGLETVARIGASTEGGNFQQQYGAIAGTDWGPGRGFVAYEWEKTTAIRSKSRDYAAGRYLTLMPPTRSDRLIGSIRQKLAGSLEFRMDALHNKRSSGLLYATNPAGDLAISRTDQTFGVESYAFAPSLRAKMGSWALSLSGTYGRDETDFRGEIFTGTTLTSSPRGRYTNRSRSAEAGASGELFDLPAGSVRLALGAGVRINDYRLFRGTGVLSNIDARQNSRFAYAELGLPLISHAMDVRFVDRLEVNAAFRHERYRGIGDITTPKLGLIYAPIPDLTLKASWGRSFRAPSFIQQYQVRQAVLLPAAVFSGTSFPAGSTALTVFGGNPNLKPERAESWSVSAALKPKRISGLSVELSYFSTRYIDRVVSPVPFLALALSDPLYADRVALSPAASLQSDLIASSNQFLNLTGGAYDPARVIAAIDTSNVNAGRQRIRGVDMLLRYDVTLGTNDRLSIAGNVSYLDSEQQLTPLQPVQPLAGLLFNPPHWRARGSASWKSGSFTTSAIVSHIGGVSDPRTTPAARVRGMTLLDLSAAYAVPSTTRGLFGNLELGVAVQNLFNAEPATIATTAPTDTPYDSTNYSPAGRVVSLRISKRW